MLVYLGKVILLYTVSVIVIRFIGKGAMAQLTPYDLTSIVFLATLAVNPLLSDNLFQAGAGICIVTLLHFLFAKLSLFRWLNEFLIGEPTILIKHGKINQKNMRRARFSLINLLAALRTRGYPNLEEIDYAILEPTGEISILPLKEIAPVTPNQLNMEVKSRNLPLAMVIQGKIQRKNLEAIGKNEAWLRQCLNKAGHFELNDVFYAAARGEGDELIIDLGEG